MRANILLSLVLGLVFISAISSAMPQAEMYLSTAELDVCPCKTSVIVGEVLNLENIPQEFQVYASQGWVIVAPNTFRLGAFGKENVYFYVTPRCDIQPGSYDVDIVLKAVDAAGSEAVIKKSVRINVLGCHNIEIHSTEDVIQGCAGSDVNLTVRIRNLGIAREKVHIETSQGILSSSEVDLMPGEEKHISLNLQLSSGMSSVELEAHALDSYASDAITIPVRVVKCYDVKLEPDANVFYGCAKTETMVGFTVKNTGLKKDRYLLYSSDGKLNLSSVELEPGESAHVVVNFTKDKPAEYELALRVASINANSEKRVKVVLNDCSGVALIALPETAEICEDEEARIDVAVKNTGVTKDTFELSASKGKLEEEKKQVDAGDVWVTELVVNGSELEVGKNEIMLKVKNGKSDVYSISINVRSKNECYGFDLSKNTSAIKINETKGYLAELEIKNKGLRAQRFLVSYDAPSWIMIAPTELELKPNETEKIYLHAVPPYNISNGTYKVVLSVRNSKGMERHATIYFVKGDFSLESYESFEKSEKESTSLAGNAVTKSLKRMLISLILALIVVVLLLFLPQKLEDLKKKKDNSKKKKSEKAKNKKKNKSRPKKSREIEDVRKILESI